MIIQLLACTGNVSKEEITEDNLTYYQDVAPILARNCLSCHTEEGTGPFSLDTYENVKNIWVL